MKINYSTPGEPIKTIIASLLIAAAMLFSGGAGAADDPAVKYNTEVIPLWPDGAPLDNGQTETSSVTLTVYHPDKPNGTAVLICPGGAYAILCYKQEGHDIAKWLYEKGITSVVVEYRMPKARTLVPLWDAQRAIRMTRANAKDWKIEPKCVGIMGFSAGGHLASTAGTHYDAGDSEAKDNIARQNSRPDFMVLVYPVITMGAKTHDVSKSNLLGPNPTQELADLYSNEKQVTKNTPPTFITTAKDDIHVNPDNSRDFYAALRAHNVPSEYVELASGGHGINGFKGPMWDEWQAKCLAFLAAQKMIPHEAPGK